MTSQHTLIFTLKTRCDCTKTILGYYPIPLEITVPLYKMTKGMPVNSLRDYPADETRTFEYIRSEDSGTGLEIFLYFEK